MKRVFGLFFLCLVVLNTVGYYGLLLIVQNQFTTRILQRIETNAGDLGGHMILTIPLQLPYSSPSEEYTATEGEIIYEGEVYRFVKQKIYHDVLYLVCVRDNQTTRIKDQIADYSRLFSGQDADHANATIKIINSISKDYTPVSYEVKNHSQGWSASFQFEPIKDHYSLIADGSIFQPPKQSC